MAASGGKEMEIAIKIAGKVESSFKSAIGAATKGLGSITKAVGAATAAAAAAVGALGVAAVNVGKEFETSMSQVAATMLLDKTIKEDAEKLATLEEAARKCGRETAFSAGEAAEALNNLAMAGYDATDAATALPTVLNLAGAGGLQLADSARYITASLAALGIDKTEENFNHFADTLAITASKAKTDVSQLGDAITTLGGTGKGLKGGTEEIAAALGILADADITGSEGGTHLRNMILSLQNPRNADAAKAFKQLGIEAYDSTGKMRGLNEIFGDISTSMEGMTDQQKNDIMSTIFKQTDLAAANALLADCGDRFDELYEAAYNSSEGIGAAAEMYAIQMDNLEGDIDILKSGLSDLGISIYKDLNGPLREMTQLATSMVGELSDAYKEGGMESMVGAVGDCLSEAVNVGIGYIPQIVTLGVNLLQSFIQGIMKNSGGLASAASALLLAFVTGLFSLVPQVVLAGIDIVLQLAQSIATQLPQLIPVGIQALGSFVSGLAGRLPAITEVAVRLIQSLTQGIQSSLPDLIPVAMNALMNFSGSLRSNVGTIVDAGIELVMTLAKSLIDNIPVFIQTIPTIITNIAGIINDNAPKLLGAGIQLLLQLAVGLIQAIPVLIANIPKIIQAIISVFTAFNWLMLGSQIITFIGNGIRSTIASIPQLFSNLVQGAHTIVSSFGWQSLGRGIIMTIANGIRSLISMIPQIFLNIGSFAVQAIKGIDWWNVGITIIQLIGQAISGAGGFLLDAIKGIGGGIKDAIMGLFTGKGSDIPDTSSQSAAVVDSYASGISNNAGTVTAAVNSMTTNAFDNMEITGAATAGAQAGQAFTTGLTDGLTAASINTEAFTFDTSAFTTTMMTAGTEGATAIGTGMSGNSQAITQAAAIMGTDINTALDSGWQKANTNAQTAMQRLATTVTDAARSAASAVKAAFENMTITIPKPKIPVINVSTSSVSYGDGGSVSVPNFSVSWNAVGGIFEQPTIFNTPAGMQGVGEAGPEAVLPLDTLWAKMKEILNEAIATSSGASLIDAFIEKLKGIGTGGGGGQPELAGAGGPTIQYSPVYNLYGSAGKEEIAEADKMSQAEFSKLMKQYEKDQQRRKL